MCDDAGGKAEGTHTRHDMGQCCAGGGGDTDGAPGSQAGSEFQDIREMTQTDHERNLDAMRSSKPGGGKAAKGKFAKYSATTTTAAPTSCDPSPFSPADAAQRSSPPPPPPALVESVPEGFALAAAPLRQPSASSPVSDASPAAAASPNQRSASASASLPAAAAPAEPKQPSQQAQVSDNEAPPAPATHERPTGSDGAAASADNNARGSEDSPSPAAAAATEEQPTAGSGSAPAADEAASPPAPTPDAGGDDAEAAFRERMRREMAEASNGGDGGSGGGGGGAAPAAPSRRSAAEEEAQRADRARREEIMREGEVRRAERVDWEHETLEVEDQHKLVVADGEDVILEITSDNSMHVGDSPLRGGGGDVFPTLTPDDLGPAGLTLPAEGASAAGEAAAASAGAATGASASPVGSEVEYPDDGYFARTERVPPSLSYHHSKQLLTLTFVPAASEVSFCPTADVVRYASTSRGEGEGEEERTHDVSVPLLHEGCTLPTIVAPPVPCIAACTDDQLKSARKKVAQAIADLLADQCGGRAVEVYNIMELGLAKCTCLIRFVGTVGDLSQPSIAALHGLSAALAAHLQEPGGLELAGKTLTLQGQFPSAAASTSLRLTKPDATRWSSLMRQPQSAGAGRMAMPSWVTPDDIDSDSDDDSDDEDSEDYS